MIRSLAAGSFIAIFALAASLSAQEKSTALTPEASLNLRSISDLQFSPDGSRLAFVVAEPPKGEERASHIWILDNKTSGVRQFTYSQNPKPFRGGRPTVNNSPFFPIARKIKSKSI
jgi:hypothetical protein